MKKMQRFISLFIVAVLAIGSFSCKKDPEVNMERVRIYENEKQFSTDGESVSMNLSGSVSYSKGISKMTLWFGATEDLSDIDGYDFDLQDTTYSITVADLEIDTVYYYRFGVYRYSAEFDKEMEIGGMQTNMVSTHNLYYVPNVETGEVSQITQTSVVVAGMVVNDGGASIVERGICWSTHSIPTITDNRTPSESDDASFSVSITGLSAETTYYVRTYAINEVGVGYGVEKSFMTLPQSQDFTISVSANPSNGGTVTGGGIYQQGQSCTVTATANSGYIFTNWTENGNQVSSSAHYSFSLNSDRSLVANFILDPNPGVINAIFSVGSTKQVCFSRGNLQYNASLDIWRFADKQYDYIGSSNSNISQNYEGWIDLFGWGTSGWNSGANCYQPWSKSTNYDDYFVGGSSNNSLTGSWAKADWGVYNAISNGGNNSNTWRTLTKEEWDYLFNTRVTPSGIRFAKAIVHGVNGVIIVPDDWTVNTYNFGSYNSSNAPFTYNTISDSQWNTIEQAGAVFLPASGLRNGTSVSSNGSYGYYWSVSAKSSLAYCIYFYSGTLNSSYSMNRYCGQSVRLVRPAN